VSGKLERGRKAAARRRRGGESGAAALEFALLAPLLFAFLFGTFELGWAMHCGASVRFAIEQASRALIIDPNTSASQIQATAQARLTGLPIDGLSVSLANENVSGEPIVRVSWQYSYSMALPYVPTASFHFDSSTVVPLPVS